MANRLIYMVNVEYWDWDEQKEWLDPFSGAFLTFAEALTACQNLAETMYKTWSEDYDMWHLSSGHPELDECDKPSIDRDYRDVRYMGERYRFTVAKIELHDLKEEDDESIENDLSK